MGAVQFLCMVFLFRKTKVRATNFKSITFWFDKLHLTIYMKLLNLIWPTKNYSVPSWRGLLIWNLTIATKANGSINVSQLFQSFSIFSRTICNFLNFVSKLLMLSLSRYEILKSQYLGVFNVNRSIYEWLFDVFKVDVISIRQI